MKGMEILLKSMGFDAEKVQSEVKKAGDEFKRIISHFDNRLNNIEANQQEILKLLKPSAEIIPLERKEG